MTNVENYRSVAKRTGYERMPVDFSMCPYLTEQFEKYCKETGFSYEKTIQNVEISLVPTASEENFAKLYPQSFKPGTTFDAFGIAHEPGSAAAYHMTKMYNPMESFDSVEQILAYPMPEYAPGALEQVELAVQQAHEKNLVVKGCVSSVCWEQAWYLRGMEKLMVDMCLGSEMAEVLLDRVLELSIRMAVDQAKCGVDVLYTGDDIGMQRTPLMKPGLYRQWLKPRLEKFVRAVHEANPDTLVMYHSCGFIKPFIPDLLDTGIDILNPIQPESMDFAWIHETYGDRVAFHGSIGTQTTMPYGTPEEVRSQVFRNLDIAGEKGGLFVAPTHLLEPDVPPENVAAYIQACVDYK